MTRHTVLALFIAAAVTAGDVRLAHAQKITEERIQELVRAAAIRAGVDHPGGQAAVASPASSVQAATAATSGARLPLTLDDAVKLALDRNLDIAVQRLNPSTFDYSLATLRGNYKPTLTSQVNHQSITNPSTSTVAGAAAGAGIVQGATFFNGGVNQNFMWGGGSLAIALNNNKQTTTALTAVFNPTYNTNWSAQFTQPLLRNFKIDNTRQQLVVTALNQDISEIQLQASIINTVSNVRNAYWDLVFATQAVGVAKRSVELAEQLVRDNQTRVEIGTMAPIDVVQAQAQAATQRQNLALAEGTRRTSELALKRLIVGGTEDENWTASIDPIEPPDFVPQSIDVNAAVRRALESRTDLQQAKKNLQVNDTTLRFLQNQTLPQMDLVARYGLVGLGGTQFITSGQGINRQVLGTIPGGYSDALGTLFGNTYPQWNLQLNMSYPLGQSGAEANVARARIQQNQVAAQLRQIELQIATDVTNAATNVQNAVERVQAAQAAREFAERQLEAEQSKFEVGMSTNYFVVQFQRDLATAQNSELQAVLAYRRSLVELERSQQTSLSSANITLLSASAVPGAIRLP